MATFRRKKGLMTLLVTDTVMLSFAWGVYYYLRVVSGLFETLSAPDFLVPMAAVDLYWIFVFWLFGLYRPWWAKSRLDELIVIFKAGTYGVLALFFLIFIDDTLTQDPATSRLMIVMYWAILLFAVGAGRLIVRSIRRRMLMAGIGQRTTLIIGPPRKAADLHASLRNFPGLGFRFIGFVSTDTNVAASPDGIATHPGTGGDLPQLASLDMLEDVIRSHGVEEILISIDSTEHERLLDIVGRCSEFKVGIKIRPDLYDIVSGQARTNQLYGTPLIEVTPQLLAPWEQFIKRTMDIGVSLLVLVLGIPLFLLIALLQKLTTKGPVLYRQQRVGKDGTPFSILKFRTMYVDAEQRSGPKWADKDDPRVTPLGRLLRRSHLDELPQVFNVLEGDMSLVGPRPERPFFVEQFVREIPLYRRRLNVRPGITGWAQVRHTYDQSIEDVRTKLSYDLFYIENMSVRMDLKIILITAYNMIAGKGHT